MGLTDDARCSAAGPAKDRDADEVRIPVSMRCLTEIERLCYHGDVEDIQTPRTHCKEGLRLAYVTHNGSSTT